MKKLKIFTLLLCITASLLMADSQATKELKPSVLKVEFSLSSQQQELIAEKFIDINGVFLKVYDKKGNLFWQSMPLGASDKLFTIDGKAVALEARDITGNGDMELITAAFFEPANSALYVFSFDATSKLFIPIDFRHEKPEFTRDFMVADVFRPNGEDLIFESDQELKTLGKMYSDDGNEPIDAYYSFKYTNDAFEYTGRKPVESE